MVKIHSAVVVVVVVDQSVIEWWRVMRTLRCVPVPPSWAPQRRAEVDVDVVVVVEFVLWMTMTERLLQDDEGAKRKIFFHRLS